MTAILRYGRFESRMRFRFRHASADRSEAENVIVELRDPGGPRGYGEGCPRHYVTGETQESAFAFLAAHGGRFAEAVDDLDSLLAFIAGNEKAIDTNPAAFCALELAALDLIGRRRGEPVESVIGLPLLSEAVACSAVVGDSGLAATWLASTAYRLWGFDDFKIKLSGELPRDRRRLALLPRHARIRVDANNLWRDPEACIRHLERMGRDLRAVEEPVQAGDIAAMRLVSHALGVRIVLDESLARLEQLEPCRIDAERWIANIRVSKCGGILRSIRLAREAAAAGFGIVLGAHVGETSLLCRAACTVGQAMAEAPPEAREGGYGNLLLVADLTVPTLRFGRGGRLDLTRTGIASKCGFGLEVRHREVRWQSTED